MTGPQRAQADEQAPDDVDGKVPAALAFVIFVAGAATGVAAAMWLDANQCIRVGGCG